MKIFSSFYYVFKNRNKEVPVSVHDYGKIDDEDFIKQLHNSLDAFIHQVKNAYDIQDVQTEFLVNLCVPHEEEEE